MGDVRYYFTVGSIIVVMAIVASGSTQLTTVEMKDERLLFLLWLIVIAVEGMGIHVLTKVFLNKLEVKEKLKKSHSIGIHGCDADPKECFIVAGKPLPLCSRHLGFYLSLFVLVITSLLMFDFWIVKSKQLSWNEHLAYGFVLFGFVAIHGVFDKRGFLNMKGSNITRLVAGIATALGWVFVILTMVSYFDLSDLVVSMFNKNWDYIPIT